MTGLRKSNLKKFCLASLAVAALCAITWNSEARRAHYPKIYSNLTADTIPKRRSIIPVAPPVKADTGRRPSDTLRNDSLRLSDSGQFVPRVDTFNLKLSKDTLDAPVNYEAEDSAVLLVREKKFLLYGKTKTTYKDVTLTAPRVEMDQQTNIVTAFSSRDSLGLVDVRAKFTQGSEGFQSDTIRYNFKTQKGLTTNTYTKTNELWVNAPVIKKVNANTTFAKGVVMTTCDYDEPHFGFKANKAKFVNNKVAITGPIHPEFEGIPIPIYLPFGFFPLNPGRHSGLLPPQFVVNEQQGIGLQGLGYYHVLNDYLDVTIRTDIYSYGSWNVTLTPSYRKRYKYSGAFNILLQNYKQNFKGDPDYYTQKTFNVRWNHSMDSRAKPGISFSASVDAGSTSSNQFVANDPVRNVQSSQNSSINYSKTWIGKPFNLTLAAAETQSSASHLITMQLPQASFTVSTIYPFQRKLKVGGARWYENIGVGYSGNTTTNIAFYDTAANIMQRIADTLQWGAVHRFPISINLPAIAGKFFLAPTISYEQTWLQHRMRRAYNVAQNKLDTLSREKGLFIDHQMNFGISLNTNIYGMYTFKNSKIIGIRHVIRPSIGFNFRPNLSKNNYDEIILPNGYKQRYAQFEENRVYGFYGYGQSKAMSFNLENNLEMKVRTKDSAAAEKKIRLIDNMSLSGSYDFERDSFHLSTISMNLSSTIVEKINFNVSASLDPYQFDTALGRPIDKYAWQSGGHGIGRLTYVSVALGTQFSSKSRNGDDTRSNTPSDKKSRLQNDPALMADRQRLQDYIANNPAEFVNFNIPWQISLNFSLTLSNNFDFSQRKFVNTLSSSVNFSNSFSLTPKWNFSSTGYYDFNTNELTGFSMAISRDMHCWQMSIQVTPIGFQRYYSFTLSPKSPILQDLKVNRTRSFVNY